MIFGMQRILDLSCPATQDTSFSYHPTSTIFLLIIKQYARIILTILIRIDSFLLFLKIFARTKIQYFYNKIKIAISFSSLHFSFHTLLEINLHKLYNCIGDYNKIFVDFLSFFFNIK